MAEIESSWHIDKKITIGHIVTTLVVGLSALSYITTVEKRVAILEEKEKIQRQITNSNLMEIKGQLIRIETKIDGKADK